LIKNLTAISWTMMIFDFYAVINARTFRGII